MLWVSGLSKAFVFSEILLVSDYYAANYTNEHCPFLMRWESVSYHFQCNLCEVKQSTNNISNQIHKMIDIMKKRSVLNLSNFLEKELI